MATGLSLLELSDLPTTWRTIIRLLMRDQPQTYAALATALAGLPAAQRIEEDALSAALEELCEQGYLVQQVCDGVTAFSTKIARKSGRKLSTNLWNALDTGESAGCEPLPKPGKPADPASSRRSRTNLLDGF